MCGQYDEPTGYAPTVEKRDEDIAVGDVIWFLGGSHRVTSLEPYEHPTFGSLLIAHAEPGWNITLFPGSGRTTVLR